MNLETSHISFSLAFLFYSQMVPSFLSVYFGSNHLNNSQELQGHGPTRSNITYSYWQNPTALLMQILFNVSFLLQKNLGNWGGVGAPVKLSLLKGIQLSHLWDIYIPKTMSDSGLDLSLLFFGYNYIYIYIYIYITIKGIGMWVLLYGENWTMVLSHMTTSITIQPYLYIHTIYDNGNVTFNFVNSCCTTACHSFFYQFFYYIF